MNQNGNRSHTGDPIKVDFEGPMSNSDTFQPGDEIVKGGKTAATAVSEDTLAEPTTASKISKPKSNADESCNLYSLCLLSKAQLLV